MEFAADTARKASNNRKYLSKINGMPSPKQEQVDECRTMIKNPVIRSMGWEKDVNIWCYFCEETVTKHSYQEDCTICCGNLIEHFALSDHKDKMNTFFWDNIIDKTKKQDYIITEDELEIFNNKVDSAVKKFLTYQQSELTKKAEKIRESTRKQQAISNYYKQQIKQTLQSTALCKPIRKIDTTDSSSDLPVQQHTNSAPRKTSFGLTVIPRVKRSNLKGNIFTGAVPPWLQDTSESQSSVIGPTDTDFQTHLKLEKKKKLPANRVGADFIRGTTDSTWLPSFGGVWSNQRRSNTRYQFERRLNGKFDEIRIKPEQIKPYKRKRTETVTNETIPTESSDSPNILPMCDKAMMGSNQGQKITHFNNISGFSNASSIPGQLNVIPYKRQKRSGTGDESYIKLTVPNKGSPVHVVPEIPIFTALPVSLLSNTELFHKKTPSSKELKCDNPYNIDL